MSNRNAILALLLVAIAIGCIVVATVRWHGAGTPPPTPVARQAPATPAGTGLAAVADEVATARDGQAPEALPPWLQPGVDTDQEPVETGVASEADALRRQQLLRLHESMRGVIAATTARAGDANRHMRAALDTLEAMDDPAVNAQLDLGALRDNFEISVKMQALALELQQVAAGPDGPDRKARMDAIIAEVRSLQSQVHADVRAPGSTLAPIGARHGTTAR